MRLLRLNILSLSICLINTAYSQSANLTDSFHLDGEIVGKDTGTMMLWWYNKDNIYNSDTIKFLNGKFHFSGTVNRVSEALLWTDINEHAFDNPTMIRFLLEPHNLYISYKQADPSHPAIEGSKSQREKEKWDKQKSSLLLAKLRIRNSIDSLYKLSRINGDSVYKEQMDQLSRQYNGINKKIRRLDTEYLKKHPNSYLSAYLLYQQSRILEVDSIQAYYILLGKDAKKSSLGYDVLRYIYPLTDDIEFRKANPLLDLKAYAALSKLTSVYDISLQDTSGSSIKLSSLKARFIVIDFWASWCKPCLENVPALNRMIQEYKNDSVQFISISLDEDADDWKQSLIKHNIIGVQLSDLKGFRSVAPIFCKVLWVPKYIVADQNGRIINYDAPQPGEPGLKLLLDNLLNKASPKPNKGL